MDIPTVAILLIGLLSGLAIGWLLAMQRMRGDMIRTEERMKAQSASESTLKIQMENIAADIGRKQNEDFLRLAEERLGKVNSEAEKGIDKRKVEVENLIRPLRDEMEKLSQSNQKIETNARGLTRR